MLREESGAALARCDEAQETVMTSAPAINAATQALSLPEELILMLLNEETGYFHQVPGWHMNCAVIGAVLAELSITTALTRTWNLCSS